MSHSPFNNRIHAIRRFYALLDRLEERIGGRRTLDRAHGRQSWPPRGVYFFFEPGERRTTTGVGDRVVRVGTHALSKGNSTTLWDRLSTHRGILKTGGGNHRRSVFRDHIGRAVIARQAWAGVGVETWDEEKPGGSNVKANELPIERSVSEYIRSMPFLWLDIGDPPGPDSLRGYIERNAIALVSGFRMSAPIDPPSALWLGNWAKREEIKKTGLWNVNHLRETPDPKFLDVLERLILSAR